MNDPAQELNQAVAAELERYPRGANGSSQNLFRAYYQSTRSMTFYEPDRTADDCEREIVTRIQETDPGFVLHRLDRSDDSSNDGPPDRRYARAVDFTIEPGADAGLALKFQTDGWEVNVYASADDVLRLRNIRTARWSERQSIQAGDSGGGHVYWASTGAHAALMIGPDEEAWDISFTVPFDVVDAIVREAAALN